jgi:chaperonin GroES
MSTEKKYPQPYQDRVIVSRKKAESVSKGGIIIPEAAIDDNQSQGTVLAIGPEVGVKTTIDKSPQPGDFVQFGQYAGTEIEFEGEKYLIMRESDIMCKL